MSQTATLQIGDRPFEFPIEEATQGQSAVNIASLLKDSGLTTLDYGFANTAVDAVLLRNRLLNRERFATMAANYDRRKRAASDGEHDMAGVRFHVLDLSSGKRVWIFPCLYGDLSRELLEALVEHGARNIVSMGTAGAISGRKVGDVLVPSEILRADGRRHRQQLPR